MAKKYLLTFSLAAISCLGTKTIQNLMTVENNHHRELIENVEALEIRQKGELVLGPRLKIN